MVAILGMAVTACPNWVSPQSHLNRLKDAGTFGGFFVTLVAFILSARHDHATGDFQFLIDSLLHLLDVCITLRQMRMRSNMTVLLDKQIKLNDKLIETYQTAVISLKVHLRVPLPLPRTHY